MSRSSLPRGAFALLVVASLGAVPACSEDPSAPAPSLTVSLTPTSSSIAQGGSTTNTVTVVGINGFVTTPTITVTGAPAGVTASVSDVVTTNATSTATVTITAASAVTPGVYPINVVASGPGVTAKAAVYTLTVTGGSFAAAFNPATLSVAQGSTGTSEVTLTRTNLTGDISLSVAGMPTGVTATLSPTSTAGTTSTLTVTAANNAALGTVNLTLTGTATGATNQTVTLPLTITAGPSVVLTLAPAALTVAQAASGSTTITLARTNFTGNATFTAENLPAGVTATFDPNPNTGAGTTTLTLTTTAATPVGLSTITIRATGTGIAAATVPLALTVTP